MASIFGTILSIESSQRTRCLLSSFIRVSWPNKFPPLSYGIISEQFHSNRVVRSHEVNKSRIEAFTFMFSIELSRRFLIELEHLNISNSELLLGEGNHFSKIEVGVGFQHSISSECISMYLLDVSSPMSSFRVNQSPKETILSCLLQQTITFPIQRSSSLI